MSYGYNDYNWSRRHQGPSPDSKIGPLVVCINNHLHIEYSPNYLEEAGAQKVARPVDFFESQKLTETTKEEMTLILLEVSPTPHPQLYTHSSTPTALHPQLYTHSSTPTALHPQLYTHSSTPTALHPQLYTHKITA
ncbi:hypothetical protein J6590_040317 [Homalodisca vitripennis]|nr:hypothetical protein J6590_040317 [Homalodisca vitripennis]